MVRKNRQENPHDNKELQEVLAGDPSAVGRVETSDASVDALRFDEGSKHAEELAKAIAADLDGIQSLAQELSDDNSELSSHEALKKAITFLGHDGFDTYNEAELKYIIERAESYANGIVGQQKQEASVELAKNGDTLDEPGAVSEETAKDTDEKELSPEELKKLWAEAIGRQYSRIKQEARKLANQENIDQSTAIHKIIAKEYEVSEEDISRETLQEYLEAALEWRSARATEIAKQLKQDSAMLAEIDTKIKKRENSFKGDPKNWSRARATADALQATGLIGENSPAGTFDNDFSVRVLSQAKQENATDRKATRAEQRQAQSSSHVSKANADTQEQAKVATVQESNEKQKITREEVLDVGVHKLGQFLYMIDKEKLGDVAEKKGEKLTWKEKQQERLAVLQDMGFVTPERAKELLKNLAGVDAAFRQGYREWGEYKKNNPTAMYDSSADAAKIRSPESGPTAAAEATSDVAPPTYEEKLSDVKARIADLRDRFSHQAFKDENEKTQKILELEALVAQERDLEENADSLKQADAERQLDAHLKELGYAGMSDTEARRKLWLRLSKLNGDMSESTSRMRSSLKVLNARINRTDAEEQAAIGKSADELSVKLGITPAEGEGREPLPTSLDAPLDANQQRGREPLPVSLDAPLAAATGDAAASPKMWYEEQYGTPAAKEGQGREPLPTSLDAPVDANQQQGREPLPTSLDAPVNSEAPVEPTNEELNAYIDSLLDEYNALENKNTPEAAAIFQKIRDTHNKSKITIEAAPATAEARGTQVEQADQPNPELVRITNEVEVAHGEKYRAALSRYAELKADSETKLFGRRKRKLALEKAQKELVDIKMAYETALITKKGQSGFYEGDADAIKKQQADELFEKIRGLDKETRQATNDIRDKRIEERPWYKRAAVRIGKFLSTGGKVKNTLKTGGIGFGVGAAKSFALTVNGVGIPVTVAATAALGAGLAVGAGRASAAYNRDQLHKAENKDAEGKAVAVVTNEQLAKIKEKLSQQTRTIAEHAAGLAHGILNESLAQGEKQRQKAEAAGRKVMGKVAAGYALGGIVGGLAGNWAHSHFSAPTADHSGQERGVGKGGHVDTDKLRGEHFFVGFGSGYERELQQFATANHQHLSSHDSHALHNYLMDKFGHDYIDIKGAGHDVYVQNGDWRLMEPGKATWEPGVADAIKDWMASNGSWK